MIKFSSMLSAIVLLLIPLNINPTPLEEISVSPKRLSWLERIDERFLKAKGVPSAREYKYQQDRKYGIPNSGRMESLSHIHTRREVVNHIKKLQAQKDPQA